MIYVYVYVNVYFLPDDCLFRFVLSSGDTPNRTTGMKRPTKQDDQEPYIHRLTPEQIERHCRRQPRLCSSWHAISPLQCAMLFCMETDLCTDKRGLQEIPPALWASGGLNVVSSKITPLPTLSPGLRSDPWPRKLVPASTS